LEDFLPNIYLVANFAEIFNFKDLA